VCKRMGQARLIPWPPSSPDLTLCDFYLWSYVKNQVYQPPDVTVPSRDLGTNFTGNSQCRWVTVEASMGRIGISRWRLRSNQSSASRALLDKLNEFPCCFQVVSLSVFLTVSKIQQLLPTQIIQNSPDSLPLISYVLIRNLD
jgi:hypothetical protein